MGTQHGSILKRELAKGEIIPFIGVHDVFSASIAAKYFDGIFISGFSFAASFYGLPDIGFISWSDMVAFVQRVRTILPHHHILVDVDDGYADVEVACHVVSLLESIGASGVILEDQLRPRRCGHFNGKQLMELEQFRLKLEKVLATRREMIVVARTDATDADDIVKRVKAFAQAGADAILVDGMPNLNLVKELKNQVGRPFAFNQIAGGKSPCLSLRELSDGGVSLAVYSTPCLFAAQSAIDNAVQALKGGDGLLLTPERDSVDVRSCNAVLYENLSSRDEK